MSVWRQMVLLYLVENLQTTVFWAWNSQMEGLRALSLFMLCLMSLLHHRMIEGEMSVWTQMVLLYMAENLQKTVFWAQNSQMEGFVSCKIIYAVSCVIASS